MKRSEKVERGESATSGRNLTLFSPSLRKQAMITLQEMADFNSLHGS